MNPRTLETIPLASLVPPSDSVEHVYSALEYDTGTMENGVFLVCYRTKDGLTHQAEVHGETYEAEHGTKFKIRKSVKKF